MTNLKKILIEMLVLPILSKIKRDEVRRILRDLNISEIPLFIQFCARKFKNKRVLLIEYNNCHGEVLVGYAKYFIDLGYDVDILTNEANIKENPFCNYQGKVNLFKVNSLFVLFLRFTSIIKQYSSIVFTSSCWFVVHKSIIKLFGLENAKNSFIVEHDITEIEKLNEQKLEASNKIITLWNFNKGIMVNPHFFGEINTQHQKNEFTNFIVVGGIYGFRKNHALLLDAVQNLSKIYTNFKITVVGQGSLDGIEEQYKKYFDIKGRLSYKDMYKELEQADFFMPLLDYENVEHHRYITTGVTGSIQLILGFLKPSIIQENFADFYKMNEKNALIYTENNDLYKSMQRAIELQNNEYELIKQNLLILEQDIYEKSLNNLQQILGGINE